MKISNKNKKILIWIGSILLILIALYIFNTYFLRENFAAPAPEKKLSYCIKNFKPIASWKNKGVTYYSWELNTYDGNNKYIWYNSKTKTTTSQEKSFDSDPTNEILFIQKSYKPGVTLGGNIKSQADCNSAGLIFKEGKCIPATSQNDCTFNSLGSLWDDKAKNCLKPVNKSECQKAYSSLSPSYSGDVKKYTEGYLCDLSNIKANIDSSVYQDNCNEYGFILVKDLYNRNVCRVANNQEECDKIYGKLKEEGKLKGEKGKRIFKNGSCKYIGIVGDKCIYDEDCRTNKCINRLCAGRNVTESCEDNSDCVNNNCVSGKCGLSEVNQPCTKAEDCFTKNCIGGKCAPGKVNQACKKPEDCTSKNCEGDLCKVNFPGGFCTDGTDCLNNNCSGGKCALSKVNEVGCKKPEDCTSKKCQDGRCLISYFDEFCTNDDDCTSGNCKLNKCRFNQPGQKCGVDTDCSSKFCVLNPTGKFLCSQRITGPCSTSEDCLGKGCVNGQCVKCANDSDCKDKEDTPTCKLPLGRCIPRP
jgi:hypothetical protein